MQCISISKRVGPKLMGVDFDTVRTEEGVRGAPTLARILHQCSL